MRQDLSKKMKANLERFREPSNLPKGEMFSVYPVLHVGAAEHLVARGLIVKKEATGFGRAKAAYEITKAGRDALAAL